MENGQYNGKSFSNRHIAKILRTIASAYILKQENRFKTVAYLRAADTIEHLPRELKTLWEENTMSGLDGIGPTITSHLDELFRTGHVRHFQDVLFGIPPTVFLLQDVPGLGVKKAFSLVKALRLINERTLFSDLLSAAEAGKIAAIEGWGEKSEDDLVDAVRRYLRHAGEPDRMLLSSADAIASDLVSYLGRFPYVLEVSVLGSLRRGIETIGDIDIAVSSHSPARVIDAFLAYRGRETIVERGEKGAALLLAGGKHVDLRVQSPQSFGAMLQYFTGSKHHNVSLRAHALRMGFSLSEYGIKTTGQGGKKPMYGVFNKKTGIYEYREEKALYRELGMDWIAPELREDSGEIDAACRYALPSLVSLENIRGDFHIHSDYDLHSSHDTGSSGVQEILERAHSLGYAYVGISDHNPKISGQSENDIVQIMKRRKHYFEDIISSMKSVRVHLFIMLEIDILPDGKLALPDEAFSYIDAAIVSVHSSFSMTRSQMTQRVLSGLSHPKANILAHPTGRLLGKRDGYDLDWDAVFSFCAQKKKAIEINAYPQRLDLPWGLVRTGVDRGVSFVIGSDSHAAAQMDVMKYGVTVARKGWAKTRDILNCLPYNDIRRWFVS